MNVKDIPVVYVAGPFRAENMWEVEENIRRAERLAVEVWRLGCSAICPHANTRFFTGAIPDQDMLDGDLAILARCDYLIMTSDWQTSVGATAERAFANKRNIPIAYSIADLRVQLKMAGFAVPTEGEQVIVEDPTDVMRPA